MDIRRRSAPHGVTVRALCTDGHSVDLRVDDVAIVQVDDVVVGYHFSCPVCGVHNEREADAAMLAALHAFGVSSLQTASSSTLPPRVGDHRRTVSLRVLLDQPATEPAGRPDTQRAEPHTTTTP